MQRGLTLAAPAPPDLAPTLFDRLNGPAGAPVALALSGGGDSLALLHLAKAWADRAGRRLIALTVDHRLQAASAGWCDFAAERAARLGVAHRSLVWAGDKPRSGLAAAARSARHALLAEAARSDGARVLLMGHTADDALEAELMRRAGSTTPSPRVWSPSPAWPRGHGVFLCRPLLGVRRSALRDLLRGLGESWIDDPANDDPRSARTLARRQIAVGRPPRPSPVVEDDAPTWPVDVRMGEGGELALSRASIIELDVAPARRVLGALAVCAAGAVRPPATLSLDRLLGRLRRPGDVVATLAGARLEARGATITACREPGEFVRGRSGPQPLPFGESVFDGRFLVRADLDGWRIAPLRGRIGRLGPAERARLRSLAPPVRAALPAAISPCGDVICPVLCGEGAISAYSLTLTRLQSALGAFCDEAALWRVAFPLAAP